MSPASITSLMELYHFINFICLTATILQNFPSESRFFTISNKKKQIINFITKDNILYEKFENTKGVIIIRISKKSRQYNGRKKRDKRTINDLQSTRK